jgi:hypothetical protein
MKNKINTYGRVAIKAAEIFTAAKDRAIEDCWDEAILECETVEKPCPKSAFLGLCEEGLVEGIPGGKYLQRGRKNKDYALAAVKLMNNDPKAFKLSATELWRQIKPSDVKNHNCQMDVVLGLRSAGLLIEYSLSNC